MQIAAIIAAGGSGQRLGAAGPKQFLDVGGRPLLDYSVAAFLRSSRVRQVVVAVPPDVAANPPAFLRSRPRVSVVAGGARRQDSVALAFAVLDADVDIVVVHDAARPFVTEALIARTVDAAAAHGAAIAAVRAHDTVKQAAPGAAGGWPVVQATLPRDTIYLAQTPQAFRRDVLAMAIDAGRSGAEATDEALLAERAGFRVHLVDGDAGNMKVTTPDDMDMARLRLDAGPAAAARIGTGYDLHRLVPDRPLILGGVRIPYELGLDGHSDADIVCHAVTDAVLGAVGGGDIGRLFPDTDRAWKDADSVALLARAAELVTRAGSRVVNVDVTVVAERPKLLPHIDAMRANLARALGCGAECVSIKGKTNEGMDSMGRGESMACHAVAMVGRV
jgi:2-C-methyl-D-erythritol 4-phosphate cytidylyltransferase/2-C-methyl-D-erythritol 2,4-cyclodiphosphate synthase